MTADVIKTNPGYFSFYRKGLLHMLQGVQYTLNHYIKMM